MIRSRTTESLTREVLLRAMAPFDLRTVQQAHFLVVCLRRRVRVVIRVDHFVAKELVHVFEGYASCLGITCGQSSPMDHSQK